MCKRRLRERPVAPRGQDSGHISPGCPEWLQPPHMSSPLRERGFPRGKIFTLTKPTIKGVPIVTRRPFLALSRSRTRLQLFQATPRSSRASFRARLSADRDAPESSLPLVAASSPRPRAVLIAAAQRDLPVLQVHLIRQGRICLPWLWRALLRIPRTRLRNQPRHPITPAHYLTAARGWTHMKNGDRPEGPRMPTFVP